MDTNISSHTSQQTETNASSHIHIRIHEFTVSLEKLSKFLPKTSNANFVSNKHKEKSYFLHVRLAMLFDFDFGNRSYFRNDISTDAHRVCRWLLEMIEAQNGFHLLSGLTFLQTSDVTCTESVIKHLIYSATADKWVSKMVTPLTVIISSVHRHPPPLCRLNVH